MRYFGAGRLLRDFLDTPTKWGFALLLLGAIASYRGRAALLELADDASLGTRLLLRFIPFAPLTLVFKNWSKAKDGFIAQIIGAGLLCLGGVLILYDMGRVPSHLEPLGDEFGENAYIDRSDPENPKIVVLVETEEEKRLIEEERQEWIEAFSAPAASPSASATPFSALSDPALISVVDSAAGAPVAPAAPPPTPSANLAFDLKPAELLMEEARKKWDKGDKAGSIVHAEKALRIYTRLLPPDDPRIKQTEAMIQAAKGQTGN